MNLRNCCGELVAVVGASLFRLGAWLLFALVTTSPAQAERLALVFGNDKYQHIAPLHNAGSDAESMATALRKAGYKVTLNRDRTLKSMKDDLRAFRGQIAGGDEVVVFFSGHGVQLHGDNFLLPVDVRNESADQVRDDALGLSVLLAEMRSVRPALMLAIIDACRDNPFIKTGRSIGGRGLSRADGATGQMVLYAAGEGQQALDRLSPNDPVRNGLFTRVFVSEMERIGVPIDQVLKNVRVEVNRLARSVQHEQVPALYDQVLGTFYFYPPSTASVSHQPDPVPLPAHLEPSASGSPPVVERGKPQRTDWASWQVRMKSDFDEAMRFVGGADLRARTWQRFLESYADDNPFGNEDEALRSVAVQLREHALSLAQASLEEAPKLPGGIAAAHAGRNSPEAIPVKVHSAFQIEPTNEGTGAIGLSSDGAMVAVGQGKARNYEVRISRVGSAVPLHVLSGHSKTVEKLMFSSDGTKLLSLQYGAPCILWDVGSGRKIFQIEKPFDDCRFLKNHEVIISGMNGFQIVDIASNKVRLSKIGDDVGQLWGASKTGIIAIQRTVNTKRYLKFLSADSGNELATFDAKQPSGRIKWMSLSFADNGKSAAWGNEDGLIRIVSPNTKKIVHVQGFSPLISPKGRYLSRKLKQGDGEEIEITEIESGRIVASLRADQAEFSPNEEMLTVKRENNGVVLYSFPELKEVYSVQSPVGIKFSENSELFFSSDGIFKLRN